MRYKYLILGLLLLAQYSYAATKLNLHDPLVKEFITNVTCKYHLPYRSVASILHTADIDPEVLVKLSHPLEALSWDKYQHLFLNEHYINNGVKFYRKYNLTLQRAARKYAVDIGIILATLGIESDFGNKVGQFKVLNTLATLGFSDIPRAAYFRSELASFLLLLQKYHLNPNSITGSYTGAIGWPQFMPSSYLYYGTTLRHSAGVDLSTNVSDIIYSIANYYHKSGWRLGRAAAVPLLAHDVPVLQQLLAKQPHAPVHCNKLPARIKKLYGYCQQQHKCAILTLQHNNNKVQYWLTGDNFAVIMNYNASSLYALAVQQLSDAIIEAHRHTQH